LYDQRDGLAFNSLLLVISAEGVDLGLPRAEPFFKEAAIVSAEELIDRAESELKHSCYASTMANHSMSMCQTLLLLTYRKLNNAQIR